MTRLEYLLQCLAEEGSETAQEQSKANRFGLDHTWPTRIGTPRERLIQEINDFLAVVEMIQDEDPGRFARIGDRQAIMKKKEKVEEMIIISREHGRVE